MGLSDLFVNANHIGAQGGSFEVQRPNNIYLIIYGLEAFGVGAVRGPVPNALTLAMESFPIPAQGNDVIEQRFGNGVRKFAGGKQADEFEVNFRDYVDVGVEATIWNWRNTVYDPTTERVGLAAIYKKQADVIKVGPGGEQMRKYRIEGLWPSRFSPGEADNNNANGYVLLQTTFQWDKLYPIAGTWNIPINTPLSSALSQVLSVGSSVLSSL